MFRLVPLALLVSLAIGATALAADPPFRRTTPRGSFGREGPELLVGIPGGRAWGIESALIPVPADGSSFVARVEVSDPAVREAFVRVAWYDRATGRPRQFAIADTRLVMAGETATFAVPLQPPPGARAYRLRVLARLRSRSAVSDPSAIRVWLGDRVGYPQVRLLP